MVVYRYLSEEELKLIESDQLEKVGEYFSTKETSNTHHYHENRRYMHFFTNVKSIYNLKITHGTCKNPYIAKFNLPLHLFLKGFGFGFGYYTSSAPRGYDNTFCSRCDVAVESRKMKKSYFVGAIKDNEENITKQRVNERFKAEFSKQR